MAGAVRVTTKVVVIDRGWNQIRLQLRLMNGAFTKVGLPEGGKTSGKHSMSELISVGAINEFGDGNKIPARSFIRSATDENRALIQRLQRVAVGQILSLRVPALVTIGRIGEKVEKMIKAKIRSGAFIRNAPSTVQKKGFDKPLIETSQMVESIQHKEGFMKL